MPKGRSRTMRRSSLLIFCISLIAVGCLPLEESPEEATWTLYAGAAERMITPLLGERYQDRNRNNRWDEGERYDDTNGNGQFDPVWIANDIRRPALRVEDDLYVSVVVFETGGQRIAIAGLDSFGHGFHEIQQIRTMPGFQSLGIDLLIMGSSHTHEGPDTVGLYGPSLAESGVDPEYMAFIRDQVVAALWEAVRELKPAVMEAGMIHSGLDTYQVDQRDPIIIDDHFSVLRFRQAENNRVISTLLNWGSHPEQVINGSAISADFVGYWREFQKQRHDDGIPVFIQGPLGGQIGSNNITFSNKGQTFEACGDCSFEKAEALGDILDGLTEQALIHARPEEAPLLVSKKANILLPMENVGFQMVFDAGTINRSVYDALGEPVERLADLNGEQPYLRSEMVYVRLGGVSMLTVPGELHPELAIGGYDGSATPGGLEAIWSDDNEGEHDLSAAPRGPYLRDLLNTPVTMVMAVTQDFVGYIMPAFNFELHPQTPYIDSHDWNHHYEETNSLGPEIARIVQETAVDLVRE